MVERIVTIPTCDIVIDAEQFVITSMGRGIGCAKTLVNALPIRVDVNVRIQGCGFRKAGVAHIDAGIDHTNDGASALSANS